MRNKASPRPCIIEGCKCHVRLDSYFDEVICRKHWRMVDPKIRDRHKQMLRRMRMIKRKAMKKNVRPSKVDRIWEYVKRAEKISWDSVKLDAEIKSKFGDLGFHR